MGRKKRTPQRSLTLAQHLNDWQSTESACPFYHGSSSPAHVNINKDGTSADCNLASALEAATKAKLEAMIAFAQEGLEQDDEDKM